MTNDERVTEIIRLHTVAPHGDCETCAVILALEQSRKHIGTLNKALDRIALKTTDARPEPHE